MSQEASQESEKGLDCAMCSAYSTAAGNNLYVYIPDNRHRCHHVFGSPIVVNGVPLLQQLVCCKMLR